MNSSSEPHLYTIAAIQICCNVKTESIFAYHFLFYLAGKYKATYDNLSVHLVHQQSLYLYISGAADPWCLMITPPLEIAISQKDFNVEWV